MKTPLLIAAILSGLTLSGCKDEDTSGIALPNCPGTSFAKEAMVFNVVAICATSGVPDEKLAHAANVTAEWLDNDGDGIADEPRLIEALETSQPFLVMTKNAITDAVIESLMPALETRVGQDLFAGETNPSLGRRDASQEEIHHLIMNAGWKVAFPDLFNPEPGSRMFAEWEKAEAEGHYFYDDPTCNANCKSVEFFYLATAAYLGSDADLSSDEMRLKDRAALTAALPGTVALMENSAYNYPLDHWPTGNYAHSANISYSP
ncbi:hypothetical protein [Octadecabacter ascidiaceicola]|uniref:Uncharacterized protein n=1 Tax=Octadecabacter ascidiaceicola TaxID=1655543 RepID=A0A238K2K4_9RHOB|nr:hypothetical protein [Octadecabacter ascidiaceicola]SMX37119.1 hypothetical protein OCA8868_01283 [Octadecabacter ascidiaceicola]